MFSFMEKQFNTAGPNRLEWHYTLPPLERWDLQEILGLIETGRYFLLHAPRQTGKTSCLIALAEYLNRGRRYRALYVNIETAQTAREDVGRGMACIVDAIAGSAGIYLADKEAEEMAAHVRNTTPPDRVASVFLRQWCESSSLPTVLMLDEVDALMGDTLVSLLRQLRSGYTDRPAHFPLSLILCGVRDLRDYRIQSAKEGVITGGSAFNVKAESLRLGNFTPANIATLYDLHTTATGQVFTKDALASAWDLTEGQPWLVNAVAHEATHRMVEYRDRTRPITGAVLADAAERIIQSRATHLDQLAYKLREDRVRRVIQPMLANAEGSSAMAQDDLEYVRDLGLVALDKPIRIANKIYREVIPRELTWTTQETTVQETVWYLRPDGTLDLSKLLAAFQDFFRRHSEHWIERFDYAEAGPQLLLQAFLQRIVNGGGRIEREYGLGRGRTDLAIFWKHPGGEQRVVIEVKVGESLGPAALAEALAQTGSYLDKIGAGEAHLIFFDRRPGRTWDEKLWRRAERDPQGRPVAVWGA